MVIYKQPYLPKDFIEIEDGLVFAVVQTGPEQVNGEQKVLCFLRYIQVNKNNRTFWQKVNTDEANAFLKINHPGYLHYSKILDANVHAVALGQIVKHHQPRRRLQQLLKQVKRDQCEQDCADLCQLFIENGLDISRFGVTGSLLIGAQKATSDIDLVVYDRTVFQQARQLLKTLIGWGKLGALTETDWHEAYDRRGCELNFADYIWHEQRKYNKAMINGRKFDMGLLAEDAPITENAKQYRKQGAIKLQCKVLDDAYGFDYPGVFSIDYPGIQTILCFTATYVGQAFNGETIEVSGLLEAADDGDKRIVVGSSREAAGEYIKVLT